MTLDLCSVETDTRESLKELYSEFIENLSNHWQGRQVNVEDAVGIYNAIQDKIFRSLSSQGLPSFSLVGRHIGHLAPAFDGLDFRSAKDLVVQAGLRSFWKKHKTAIIVTVVAIAVIATVVVVSVATAGGGTGPATALGAAAIGETKSHLIDEKQASPQNQVPVTPLEPMAPDPISHAPSNYNGPLFLEDGVMLNGERYAYWEFLQKTRQEEFFANFLNAPKTSSEVSTSSKPTALYEPIPPQPGTSILGRFFEAFGREFIGEELIREVPHPPLQTSHLFTTEGNRSSTCRVGGINGINTALDFAVGHADHINKFTPNQSIDWVYNNSHGALTDALLEVPLNYVGVSPYTAKLLTDNWVAFDLANKDNQKARYLQFCHSQGAIHVRNALLNAPKEISDRIIVVAIAPAAVISRDLCFQSFNYASKKDIVPLGDFFSAVVADVDEHRKSSAIQMALDRRRELILLDPHPDSQGIDHDFRSPTFVEPINKHIKDYFKHNGEYE